MLELGFRSRGRELIAALVGCALGVVRQPVFVGINTDEVFQRTGHTDFFVGLELRQIDEHVGIHRRAAQHVLMAPAGVALICLGHVERSAEQTAVAVESDELTGVVQPDECFTRRITGELRF